ncbi:hypothetical protein [Phytohabitans aurantiacus]|jgi:hypothetical protein|uniref:Polymerase nucleotidyl transferase domain-containing protein n=1 Tax=Phytohabitans aurantiacus TaxID=3016789 RepID=A0ABQ5R0G1_9ACTN|nr:hypothetical protein [Phytohabitans aurantiacus]GLH99772.1 hypothetical protein Pa4123_50480 [Phytohabitans aurantiacus]
MLGDIVVDELRTRFALEDARAVLLVGSRADGLDYAGSDIDFLAVYESESRIPATIPFPGAVRTDSSLGGNWLGTMRGEEVNVETVSMATVRRVAALAAAPLTGHRTAVLQPLEVRLLSRLATGQPVGGGPSGARLAGTTPLRRLPAVVTAMHCLGVASYLDVARSWSVGADALAADLVLLAATNTLGMAALAVRDTVVYAPKKVGLALRKLERDGRMPPVREAELRGLVSAGHDHAARLDGFERALVRVRTAVAARATTEGGAWREALTVIAI